MSSFFFEHKNNQDRAKFRVRYSGTCHTIPDLDCLRRRQGNVFQLKKEKSFQPKPKVTLIEFDMEYKAGVLTGVESFLHSGWEKQEQEKKL